MLHEFILANPLISLIPSLIGLGTSIYGGIKEGQQQKKLAQMQQNQQNENDAWYNDNYYSDYTQRADNQRVIKQIRDGQQRANDIQNRTSVVAGETPEAINAQKNRTNQAMTNLMSNIASNGARYKDNIQQQYRNRKAQLDNMQYNDTAQDAQSSNNILYNGIKTLGSTDWTSIFGNNNGKNNNGN